jgi:hypothetical protein
VRAAAVETSVVGDVLWARLDGLGAALSTAAFSPAELLPAGADLSSCTVRELPYSLDFLLENFMDPA